MSFAQYLGVPAYFYPGTSDYWERLIAAGTRHVIVNPSSGPGASEDPLYTAQIEACQAAGINCYGYLATTYGAKSAVDVNAEVDDWYAFYPDINGIFFDEVSTDEADILYYQTARAYVISVAGPGFGKVVLNFGTEPDEIYMSNADICVTFEDTYANYLNYVAPTWGASYSPDKYWHMVHTCPLADMPNCVTLTKNNRAGVVFITSDIMANPYDTMPVAAYYTAEAAAVAVVVSIPDPEEEEEEAVTPVGTEPVAYNHNAFRYGDKHNLIEFNRNGGVPLLFTTLPPFVNQNWVPAIDNYYDLGSLAKRWRDIHIGRNASIGQNLNVYGYADVRGILTGRGGVKVGTSLMPYTGTVNVGGTGVGERFGAGYFTSLDVTNNVGAGTIGVTGLSTLTGGLRTGAAIQTSGAGAHDIGSNANPFKDLYITGNVYKNGVAIGATPGYQHIYPELDNTYDIGSVGLAKRWRNLVVAGQSVLSLVLPAANNTYTIGNFSYRFLEGWFSSIKASNLIPADLNGTAGSGTIGTSADWWYDLFVRRVHAYDIDASNNLSGRYVYANETIFSPAATFTNLTVTGTLTYAGATQPGAGGSGAYPLNIVASSVSPQSDGAGSIGSFFNRWGIGYFTTVNANNMGADTMTAALIENDRANINTLNVAGTATVKDLIVTGTLTAPNMPSSASPPAKIYWQAYNMPINGRNWYMGDYYMRENYAKESNNWFDTLQIVLEGVSTLVGVVTPGRTVGFEIGGGPMSIGSGSPIGNGSVNEYYFSTATSTSNTGTSRFKRANSGYVRRSWKQFTQHGDSMHCSFNYVIQINGFAEGGAIPDTTPFMIVHQEILANMSNPTRVPFIYEGPLQNRTYPIGVAVGNQLARDDGSWFTRSLSGQVRMLPNMTSNSFEFGTLPVMGIEMIWFIESGSKPSYGDVFELNATCVLPLRTSAPCTFSIVPSEPQQSLGGTTLFWDPLTSGRTF